jgi:DNA-binding CsgD family transcriptional regulator
MKPFSPIGSPPVDQLSTLIATTGPRHATSNPNDSLPANLLDDMACALLVVDRSRFIHYANAAGHEVLSQGLFLRNQDGVLAATPFARPMLNLVIATVLHHADDPANPYRSRMRHVVLSDELGTSRIAYVRALSSPEGGPGGRSRTHALIALPAAPEISLECAAAFAQMYGLTPTEQRVLVHVANGETLKATGAALRIASATVTTHLKHIFDKTGVRRQSDLLALLLRNLPPLVR